MQWLAHTRPDISYGAKELARSLQAPTPPDNKKLEHMIRYLQGTRYMRHNLRPKVQTQDKRIPLNINTYTDANWASRQTTRKSTTEIVLYFFGAAVHYGSRTQATIALSSGESELYAIGTAAQESLYISNFIKEALEVRTNIKTHRQQRSKINRSCDTSSHNNVLRAKPSQCARQNQKTIQPTFLPSLLAATHSTNTCTQLVCEAIAPVSHQ